MTFNKILISATIFSLIFFISSCKDDVNPINEEEVINEVTLTMKDETNNTYIFSYKDSDGSGPADAVVTADNLPANKLLTGAITLTNTLAQPADNITNEVLEEAAEHQFFYLFSGINAPKLTYTDSDVNGKPIGIQFKLETKDAYSGKMKVVLRHQPSKDAGGVSGGDITNAGGATDLEIEFDTVVE